MQHHVHLHSSHPHHTHLQLPLLCLIALLLVQQVRSMVCLQLLQRARRSSPLPSEGGLCLTAAAPLGYQLCGSSQQVVSV